MFTLLLPAFPGYIRFRKASAVVQVDVFCYSFRFALNVWHPLFEVDDDFFFTSLVVIACCIYDNNVSICCVYNNNVIIT